ncbi:hypothetical protein [Allochromatium warmingii]|uniref:hypothetical protein n=1 Tax=Allochromatium warmingii TaxID=61595 RepID=UPI000B8054B4|nr:hypothetical protein [Allochromatium warmingii]
MAVAHEFNSTVISRSGLDRCLPRHDVAKRQAVKPQPIDSEARPVKPFTDYEQGFVHVDVRYLPRLPDEDRAQYLFAAIDPATRSRISAKNDLNSSKNALIISGDLTSKI